MLELPQWAHELATLATLAAASGWLLAHFIGISRKREQSSGSCTRCSHNPAPEQPSSSGRRSPQLKVL